MTEERLLELCKALFGYILHECYDSQCEADVIDEIGLSYDEYVQLGGKLTREELAEIELGVHHPYTSYDKEVGFTAGNTVLRL